MVTKNSGGEAFVGGLAFVRKVRRPGRGVVVLARVVELPALEADFDLAGIDVVINTHLRRPERLADSKPLAGNQGSTSGIHGRDAVAYAPNLTCGTRTHPHLRKDQQ